MKFIISFTTSPTRIYKIEKMMNAIINQTVKPYLIILNIPKIFHRTNETYQIPDYLNSIYDKFVINHIETDYGPATKIYPTIKYLRDNNYTLDTRIIYLDDDIVYLPKMIESYKKRIESSLNIYNKSVLCTSGFDFINLKITPARQDKKKCSIVEGYGSVCVSLACFSDDFEEYFLNIIKSKDCFLSDDITLSNYFHKKSIPCYILNTPDYSIRDIWMKGGILEYGNQEDALHNGANGTSNDNAKRYISVIKYLNVNKQRFFKIGFITNNLSRNIVYK